GPCRSRSSAASPSLATSTVCPSSCRPWLMKLATLRSSSTMRIRMEASECSQDRSVSHRRRHVVGDEKEATHPSVIPTLGGALERPGEPRQHGVDPRSPARSIVGRHQALEPVREGAVGHEVVVRRWARVGHLHALDDPDVGLEHELPPDFRREAEPDGSHRAVPAADRRRLPASAGAQAPALGAAPREEAMVGCQLSHDPPQLGGPHGVAVALHQHQDGRPRGVTAERLLQILDARDRAVVDLRDDVAGLEAGGLGAAAVVDTHDEHAALLAQTELLRHRGCERAGGDTEGRKLLARSAVSGWMPTPSQPRVTWPAEASWLTTGLARLTGIANPMPTEPPLRLTIAVLMPTTWPRALISGPPLLPGLMEASVWMKSSYGPSPMTRPVALTMPVVTVCSRPNGLPIAITGSPTLSAAESPSGIVGSPWAST